jgi:DNA-3-methyladenine glycosylase I
VPASALRTETVRRCAWADASPELRRYHDREYGVRIRTPRAYFERLTLELFQAGLSWRTILAKRAAFRRAFTGFAPGRVARFTSVDRNRLLRDAGIVRNRRKIDATIANAKSFLRVSRRPGGFAAFLQALPLTDRAATVARFRAEFSFMGPEIVGEFLMSTGWWPVRHEPGCFLAVCKRIKEGP